jgi:two-component system, sensor histidine kinase PdtaS
MDWPSKLKILPNHEPATRPLAQRGHEQHFVLHPQILTLRSIHGFLTLPTVLIQWKWKCLLAAIFFVLTGYCAAIAQEQPSLESLELYIFNNVRGHPLEVYDDAWQLLERARNEENLVIASKAHNHLSTIWNWRNDLDSSLYHARMALQVALRSSVKKQISNGYNMLGNAFESIGKLDSAVISFEESLHWAKKTNDSINIARALLNIGMILRTQGEYLKSLERLHEAKDRCEQGKLNGYLPNLYLTIGEIYLLLREPASAWENLHQALRRARANHQTRVFARSMIALGNQAKMVADIPGIEAQASAAAAATYIDVGAFHLAHEAAQNALKISLRDHDTIVLSQAYYALGRVELHAQHYSAAYRRCEQSYALAQKSGQINTLMDICDCLWRSADLAGNGQAAFHYHRAYVQLRDSLLGIENSMAIARLEARLDYERQHSADSLLQAALDLERDATHREELALEHQRSRTIFWAGIFAIVFAAVAGAAMIVFRRQNTRLVSQNVLIQNQHDAINDALHEKEVLLQEVHHRVKNNLQVMISLLELQSDRVEDQHAREVLLASKGRVQAMTLIHQKLYQQQNLSGLEFGIYLRQLAEALQDLFPIGHRVEIDYQLGSCTFGIDIAVPLGLILNELVTNAFKYAYLERDSGRLRLSLRVAGGDSFEMVVEDDGPGLPADFKVQRLDSLGLQLVQGLSRQLKGAMTIGRSSLGGSQFLIQFKSQAT